MSSFYYLFRQTVIQINVLNLFVFLIVGISTITFLPFTLHNNMDSIYSSMFPDVQMSDEPQGIPTQQELTQTALIHQDEHLQHEQPQEPTKSDYYKSEFANGLPDYMQHQQESYQQAQQQDNSFEQQYQQAEQENDFWYIPQNLPPEQLNQVLLNKFGTLQEYLSSEPYLQEIEQYKQQRIQEVNEEISDFAIAYQAMQRSPKDFMAQYLPEVLLEYGISPVLTQQEIGQKVQEQLKQMYGEDYQQQVNPSEMFLPGSYTSMLYNTQQQLFNKYVQQNEQNEQLVKRWGEMVANGEINSEPQQGYESMPVEAQLDNLVNEYESNWKQLGYSEDEFVEFVTKAKETNMSMQEVHKVVYFNDYLTAAYKQGLEQGKQSMYQNLQRTGNASQIQYSNQQTQTQPQTKGYDEREEINRMMKILSQGGIPAY